MKYKYWLNLIVVCGLLLALSTSTENRGAKDLAQSASLSAQVVRASGPAAPASAPAAQASGQTPFTMVIMNDPQIDWGTSPDCYKLDWPVLLDKDEQDYCKNQNNGCSSLVEAKYRAQAIAKVKELGTWPITITLGGGQVQQPVAVVINGDLTQYSHYQQLDMFKRYHVGGLGSVPMLPGLGNHDYANNVDNCIKNNCARRSVLYLLGSIWGGKVKHPDGGIKGNFPVYWVQDLDWVVPGSSYADGRGSLAYSWERGGYHFVQLNNDPTYTTTIRYDDGWFYRSREFNITSSMDWLQRDLTRATQSGKKIVINLHDYGDHWKPNNDPTWLAALRKNNVVALFKGHVLRGGLGYVGDVDGGRLHNAFGDDIPIFQAGHTGDPDCDVSDKFLLVEFGDTYMNVGTIDTYTNTNSLPGQPTFFQPSNSKHLATYTYTINTPPTNPPYSFLAVGVPYEDVFYQYDEYDWTWQYINDWPTPKLGDYNDAGAVNVLYHTEHGDYYQNWVQGLPGAYTTETADRHGDTLATGDFNGDGYPDLAAGSPGESLPGQANDQEGIVSVVYGSPTGLHGSILIYGQHSPGLPSEQPEAKDEFGSALAVGDFNGDGRDDLAVGVPYEDIEGKGNNAGVVNIFYGGAGGLSAGSLTFKEDDVQNPAPDSNGSEGDDRFGFALAAGDFNGDGRDDLAVGAPGEDIEVKGADRNDGGRVHIFYGRASGLSTTGSRTFEENDVQNPAPDSKGSEKDDRFGSALAAGDFNGDGRDDLAVGALGEDIEVKGDDRNDGGRVHIFCGGAGGLTATGSRTFEENHVPGGNSETDDRFGSALATGDFNGDGRDDLAVGAPGEDIEGKGNDAGVVNIFYGGAGGLSATGSRTFEENHVLRGKSEGDDRFGYVLAAGDFNGDGRDDLAVGAPGEDIEGKGNDAGVVNIFYGRADGLSAIGSRTFSQDYIPTSDGAQGGDGFGHAVAIGGVPNRPPTVEAGPDRTIREGNQFIGPGSFTDPNPDTWSATVDYGDGSGSQPLTLNPDRTFTLSHTYADDGTYTVTVTVTDHHGAAGTDTVTVTVPNVAPTVSAGGNQTVNEGDIVALDPATFGDPGFDCPGCVPPTDESFVASIDWGEVPVQPGTVTETPGSPGVDTTGTVDGSYVYADNGMHTVSVCVEDDDGAETCDTLNVTVENVAPVSNIDTLTDERDNVIGVDVPVALVGLDVYLAGSFNDAGTLDTHTANISWGDETPIEPGDVTETPFGPPGSTEGMDGDVTGSHAYRNPGDYTITLSVIDDDDGVGTATAPIRVADPVEATEEVIEDLISLAEDDPNVAAALDKLRGEHGGQAENGALDMLEQGNLNAGLEKIKQGLQELEAAEAVDPNLDLSYIKDLLALTAKSTAVEAIGQAEAVATKPNELRKIQQAKDLVAQGDTLLEASDYVGAVDKYQRAVREVQGIH